MATYFVRKTGNDANAGTSAGAAKLTIQAAVNLATTAGDIVYVGAGSYRESVSLGSSGSAGNVISVIGDYAGAQTGDAGVVRVTGSDNDLTATRASAFTVAGKSYIRIQGFEVNLCTAAAIKFTGTTVGLEVVGCTATCSGSNAVEWNGTGHTNGLVDQCFLSVKGAGVLFDSSAGASDSRGHVVQRCLFLPLGASTGGVAYGVFSWGAGGVTVRNCAIYSAGYIGIRSLSLNSGQSVTVNNCIVQGAEFGLFSDVSGRLVEDYNALSFCGAARTNVSTGSNSNTRPMLPDVRWFHAMIGGGTLVSPFDLASYSQLVELNSGTGAPSTDLRGISVQGSFREWGPLEYDSTLSVSGGSALGLPIVGSAIVRGVG